MRRPGGRGGRSDDGGPTSRRLALQIVNSLIRFGTEGSLRAYIIETTADLLKEKREGIERLSDALSRNTAKKDLSLR